MRETAVKRRSARPHFLRLSTPLLVCGAAVGLLAPHPARAQVINQYFPALGSGVGGWDKDLTRQQALAAYQPPGLSLGGFQLDGEAGEAVGFDSNVDGLPGGARSAMIDTSGSLDLHSRWSRHQLNAAFTVDDTRFPSRSAQDRTTWTAQAGGIVDFGHDRLGLSYSHLSLVQMPTDLGAAASRERIPYQVDQGALSYTLTTHTRWTLIPGVDLRHYSFSDTDLPVNPVTRGGGALLNDQSYRDRLVGQESLAARYDLTDTNALVVVARGTQIRYDHDLPGIPGRDSNGFAVLAGIDLHGRGAFEGRALVGYQERDFTQSAYATIRAPIAQVELAWLPTRLTTVSANITNGIEDGAFESVVGFTATTATLRVQHEYARNITLGAHVDVQKGSYPATPAVLAGTVLTQPRTDQKSYGGGIDMTWLINRHLRLDAAYTAANQNAIDTTRFTTHTVLIRLRCLL